MQFAQHRVKGNALHFDHDVLLGWEGWCCRPIHRWSIGKQDGKSLSNPCAVFAPFDPGSDGDLEPFVNACEADTWRGHRGHDRVSVLNPSGRARGTASSPRGKTKQRDQPAGPSDGGRRPCP